MTCGNIRNVEIGCISGTPVHTHGPTEPGAPGGTFYGTVLFDAPRGAMMALEKDGMVVEGHGGTSCKIRVRADIL